jgi:signal transduction histidine kinase
VIRPYPASLRGRLAVMLVAGTLTVLVAGTGVAVWSLSSPNRGIEGFDFAGRVVTLAVTANRLPGADRPLLRDIAAGAGVVLETLPSATEVHADSYTDRIRSELERELEPLGLRVLLVGHASPANASRWTHGDIVASIGLTDGTVLTFARSSGWSIGLLLRQLAPILLVFGGGLALLALWASAKVTHPLSEFAAAAARLGTNVDAAPLAERGPTELKTAARVFNTAQARIRRLLEDRAEMLAAIAHDLRTPLMRLHLRAEHMADAEQRTRMQRDLDEMEQMIGAALAFAREDAAQEPRVEIDLRRLLEEIRAEFTELGRAVAVTGPPTVPYRGQRLGLKRALSNLIDNAVKYGHHADVTIDVDAAGASITIDDSGPGIPPAQHDDVFRPFVRVERSRNRDTGGTGLGLPLARAALRAHGGEVILANRAGGGLRQTVTLPKPTAASPAA